MPWKIGGVEDQRWSFVQQALHTPALGFAGLCRVYGISRRCGYKWLRRAQQLGSLGLKDLSRRPHRLSKEWTETWRAEVFALHRRHYRVGARKLRALLKVGGRRQCPAERTIHRWLLAAGLVHPPARARQGPWRFLARPRLGRRPNDVWTVDFKGWFHTADGRRVQLLTVRDLASRYVLAAHHLPRVDDQSVGTFMRRLFRRHGRPKAIRVDRGAPFSSDGPRHWSRLSVGWLRAGIAVQISRRARPQDNGAHEQMHRVLKANTATPPALTLRTQQRRLDRWRRWYNEQRPHQSLRQQPPARHYRRSARPWPAPSRPLVYPAGWITRVVDRRGYIFWRGQRWQIGRAFYRQPIGLRPHAAHTEVYFDTHVLGRLIVRDHLIHPVRLHSPFTSN